MSAKKMEPPEREHLEKLLDHCRAIPSEDPIWHSIKALQDWLAEPNGGLSEKVSLTHAVENMDGSSK
jgi:hypothetical protein